MRSRKCKQNIAFRLFVRSNTESVVTVSVYCYSWICVLCAAVRRFCLYFENRSCFLRFKACERNKKTYISISVLAEGPQFCDLWISSVLFLQSTVHRKVILAAGCQPYLWRIPSFWVKNTEFSSREIMFVCAVVAVNRATSLTARTELRVGSIVCSV